jgi:hypothetical protein
VSILIEQPKTEIAVAEEAVAAAAAKLHVAEAALNGARNAHAEALREYFAVAGKLSELRSVRYEGGRRMV